MPPFPEGLGRGGTFGDDLKLGAITQTPASVLSTVALALLLANADPRPRRRSLIKTLAATPSIWLTPPPPTISIVLSFSSQGIRIEWAR